MISTCIPISWEDVGKFFEVVAAVGTAIIAYITLKQQEEIKALSELVKSSQFMKPSMLRVIDYQWIDEEAGRLKIVLQNQGKPLFIEDNQWIVDNIDGSQHNSFSITNKESPDTLLPDIDQSRNKLNAMIFPAMVDYQHRLILYTQYQNRTYTGTSANMSMTISFIDAEGIHLQQKLLGHPYNVIYTGNIKKIIPR